MGKKWLKKISVITLNLLHTCSWKSGTHIECIFHGAWLHFWRARVWNVFGAAVCNFLASIRVLIRYDRMPFLIPVLGPESLLQLVLQGGYPGKLLKQVC